MGEAISSYATLLARVKCQVFRAKAPFLISISGPPATGKSTLAKRLVADLNMQGYHTAFCPMDGFHLTNEQLEVAGLRHAKGRIDTFDGAAFAHAVKRLHDRVPFWWPCYSRTIHNPIPEGTRITGEEAVFVVEGNYVHTNVEPWKSTARALGLSLFIDAPDDVLYERLLIRHQRGGLSEILSRQHIENTDLPNARAIRHNRLKVDVVFEGLSFLK